MKRIKPIIICITLMIALHATAQYKIEVLDTNTFTLGEGVVLSKTSFRGLSVVDDQTIWVSGSRGTVARSVDGGKTFHYNQLKGYEKSDFRDIEAFDNKRAIIMSSGTPAYILKTTDGGQTWKEVYKNTDTAYFLDAMDFWDDQRGILVGDPINGHFVLLQTDNEGETWKELDSTKTPQAIEGEAVFAASGTSLRCGIKNNEELTFAFVSGGTSSSLFEFSNDLGFFYCYNKNILPILHGVNSRGAFSFIYSISAGKYVSIVGGDYVDFNKCDSGFVMGVYKIEGCEPFWEIQVKNSLGYRSCIEEFGNDLVITCGTSGVDYGFTKLRQISNEPFHVVRKAKKGKAVFLAGPKGKIGKLIY